MLPKIVLDISLPNFKALQRFNLLFLPFVSAQAKICFIKRAYIFSFLTKLFNATLSTASSKRLRTTALNGNFTAHFWFQLALHIGEIFFSSYHCNFNRIFSLLFHGFPLSQVAVWPLYMHFAVHIAISKVTTKVHY